jgi:hypothetical protein
LRRRVSLTHQASPPVRVFAAAALALALASIPLFSTVLPPLLDYPNHLTRFWLLASGGDAYYAVRWAPLPNLAGDVVVPLLARAMPLPLAGKLFLIASFALTLIGAAWLNRMAHGGWRLWPLLATAFLYNRPFLWGLINYLFGLGVALCSAALWLAAERTRWWLRLLASSLAAVLCFFSHIAAFGVYGLMILGLEAGPAWRELRHRDWRAVLRRVLLAAAQFALPAVLVAWRPEAQGHIEFGHVWRKADLLFTVFDNYNRPFDVACFALLLALLGGLARRRRLNIAPRLAPALALVAAAYLLLPSQMMTGSGVDRRIAVAVFVVLIAAAAPRFASRRTARLLGGAAAVVLLARLVAIEAVWIAADRAYRADLAAIDMLPRGAKLAVAYPPNAVNVSAIPDLHVPTLAEWRRGAFVPTLFAYPTQQPIALRPLYGRAAAAIAAAPLWAAFVAANPAARAPAWRALAGWDAVAFVDGRPFTLPPNPCLTPLLPRPTFWIVLVRHGRGCPPP